MDGMGIVFWGCVAMTGLLCHGLLIHYRKRLLSGGLSERTAKHRYSWSCVGIGVVSGTVIFLGTTRMFGIPLGHGEAIIAAPILNFLLAIVLVLAGRIVLGW